MNNFEIGLATSVLSLSLWQIPAWCNETNQKNSAPSSRSSQSFTSQTFRQPPQSNFFRSTGNTKDLRSQSWSRNGRDAQTEQLSLQQRERVIERPQHSNRTAEVFVRTFSGHQPRADFRNFRSHDARPSQPGNRR